MRVLVLLPVLAACGATVAPTARDRTLSEIDAAQRRGQHDRAVTLYEDWHAEIRHYDEGAIRRLALGALRHAAADESPSVRGRALAIIRRFDPPELADVTAAALDDPDPSVRVRAAAARMGEGDRARRIVLEAAAGGEPGARAIALGALASAGDDATRRHADAALSHEDVRVRRAAASAIARAGGDGSATRLLEATEDPDGTVRAEALAGLVARDDDPRRIDPALAALEDDYLGARLAAIRILATAGDRGKEALIRVAASTDAYVALRAAVALRKHGHPVPADAVRRALGDRRWNVRVAALNAVAEVTSRDTALDMVSRALVDDRAEVRLAAARVLARLGETARASQTFYSALEDPEGSIRVQAAVAILRMGDDSALEILGRLLASPDAATRAAAARALAQSDDVSLVLVRALGDSSSGVRLAAAGSLLSLMR